MADEPREVFFNVYLDPDTGEHVLRFPRSRWGAEAGEARRNRAKAVMWTLVRNVEECPMAERPTQMAQMYFQQAGDWYDDAKKTIPGTGINGLEWNSVIADGMLAFGLQHLTVALRQTYQLLEEVKRTLDRGQLHR